jgi:hypothetical protein
MTFGGENLRGQSIPVAWQNRSQQRIAEKENENEGMYLQKKQVSTKEHNSES